MFSFFEKNSCENYEILKGQIAEEKVFKNLLVSIMWKKEKKNYFSEIRKK